jgi:hypothetical protein
MTNKPIRTVEEVAAIARSFLISHDYKYAKLTKVGYKKEDDAWILTFDVGVLDTELKTVKVSDENGKVIGFE